jgi:hypothetical protein
MADPKLYRRDEVANHNSSQSVWIIIHNSVYSVTEFLNEVGIAASYVFVRSDLQDSGKIVYCRNMFGKFILLYLVWKYVHISCVSAKI